MTLAFASLETTGTASAGATSHATGSLTPAADRGYVVFVFSTRGSSNNPNSVTLAGWGLTWTPGPDYLMSTTSTTRRRVQSFWAQSFTETPSAGALTFSYTNTPSSINWIVVEITGCDPSVIKAANVGTGTPNSSYAAGSLKEDITLAALDAGNTVLSFAATNVSGTALRGELGSDSGGDADHTTIAQFNSGTSVARTIVAYHGTDTTPGSLNDSATAFGQISIEIVAAAEEDPEPEPQSYATVADAMAAPPLSTFGMPIGSHTLDGAPVGGVDDWRFVVEALLPSAEGAVVGTAVVGTTLVAANVGIWYDLTEHVRGVEWFRGSFEFGQAPEVGVATITLDSPEHLFAPWNWSLDSFGGFGAHLGPGVVIRISVISPTLLADDEPYVGPERPGIPDPIPGHEYARIGWVPQFCGLVESWPEETVADDADAWVTITVVETVTALARIDDHALSSPIPVSSDEERIRDLLDLSAWPYGYLNYGGNDITVQATYASGPRLAELDLTAISASRVFRTDRTGAAVYRQQTGAWPTFAGSISDEYPPSILDWFFPDGLTFHYDPTGDQVPYVLDSLTVANDDAAIINHVVYARVGGTATPIEDPASIARHGRRSARRTDLIPVADSTVDAIAEHILTTRARLTRRIDRLELNDAHPNAWAAAITIDLGDRLTVIHRPRTSPVTVTADVTVRSLTHRVTPLGTSNVVWTLDLGLDTLTMEATP